MLGRLTGMYSVFKNIYMPIKLQEFTAGRKHKGNWQIQLLHSVKQLLAKFGSNSRCEQSHDLAISLIIYNTFITYQLPWQKLSLKAL